MRLAPAGLSIGVERFRLKRSARAKPGRQELSKDEAAGTRSLRARGGRGRRALPAPFARWLPPRLAAAAHQLALLEAAEQRRSTLLIAPTGAGKTLAGFLPSLVDLAQRRREKRETGAGLHTLYVSPLKALAVDVARNSWRRSRRWA